MVETIKLCGHHLGALRDIHHLSKEEFFRTLTEDPYQENIPRKTSWVPYVDSIDDPFMKLGYDDLKDILKNPEQGIVLIADEPDFICQACPSRVKEVCIQDEISRNKSYGVFGNKRAESKDVIVARDFGLKIGVPYTARQIREALRLPTSSTSFRELIKQYIFGN